MERKLSDVLKDYEGATIIDQEGPNILVYKPRRSSKKKASQNSSKNDGNNHQNSQPSSNAVHSENPTPKHQKKPPKETQPKKNRASKQPSEQGLDSAGKQVQDVKTKKIKFSQVSAFDSVIQRHDIEQPSTHHQRTSQGHQQSNKPSPPSISPNKSATSSCCGGRMGYRIRSAKATLLRFKGIKFVQLCLAIYIIVLTFADIGWPGGLRDTETGLIIDDESPERTEKGLILVNGTERAIVASTLFQVACIGVARVSAWLMYPVALCFHTPTSAIPNGGFTLWVFGILLVWYFLDFLFCSFFMTEKIDTTKFSVLPGGVRMTMEVSKRFQKMGAHGGVCYICLPWVSKNQWHAFSLFENPSNPAERQIFIQKTGDWTSKVHRILQRDTVRPAWIHGPFPSPYDNAIEYDNQILVASGIGITPALSVIRAHKDSRRINLIWAVRDPYLLDFFLRHMYLDHQGWNLIFYTGTENLKSQTAQALANTNICVISGRPKLAEIIPNIIFGVESSLGLPERYSLDTKAIASEMLTDRVSMSNGSEDLVCYASELGYHLPAEAIDESLGNNRNSRKARRRTSESIMENLAIGFRPWDYHSGASDYVKQLDKKMVISTWGMMYCGGAKPVLKDLKQISDEYQLGLHVESFAW
eukprot:scaffold5395_cov126-Cylindrotheca_fusiformis.AAC.2